MKKTVKTINLNLKTFKYNLFIIIKNENEKNICIFKI